MHEAIREHEATVGTTLAADDAATAIVVERLALTGFRNYARLTLDLDRRPVVLVGPNGAGKTNLLEAVSLLAPGQGLRRAPFPDLARAGGPAADAGPASGGWAVAATVRCAFGAVEIGTGLGLDGTGQRASGRIVRIDGETQTGSGALADYVDMLWLTPAMDGLFMGSGSDRRRFLDRLTLCFDPAYRTRIGHFERAMQQRNRLLADNVREPARFDGLERVMAETGVAIAAARAATVAELGRTIETRRQRTPDGPFPWADVVLAGTLDAELAQRPALDVEDLYLQAMRRGRERDRAAGRTLEGPHRSDLVVGHGPKAMPARLCSTGEQKALLIGLILAHAELLRQHRAGLAPILLLDEIAAHLDEARRRALFDEILHLGCQAWMTGTDLAAFAPLTGKAQMLAVDGGAVTPVR